MEMMKKKKKKKKIDRYIYIYVYVQVVVVPDTVDPEITLLGGSTVALQLGEPFIEPGFIATDEVKYMICCCCCCCFSGERV